MYPWVHLCSTYRGQWLPGDPRGFHSRKHRIHSLQRTYSDDPYLSEHKGLEVHTKRMRTSVVELNDDLKAAVLEAMRAKLVTMAIPTAALAAQATHLHALIKVGDENAKPIFGRAKQAASHALRRQLPGQMWGASSGVTRIRGFRHFASSLWYILAHEREGARVWCNALIEKECAKKYPDYRESNDYQFEWGS